MRGIVPCPACLARFVGAPCHREVMETRHCPGCRAERVVEQPPCMDGHDDCPEWVCTECGTAIVFGWLTADIVSPARRVRRSA
jgi:hypothetical protein